MNKVGVFVQSISFNTFSSLFSSQIGRIKKSGPGEKIFLLIFCLSCFLSKPNSEKCNFPSYFSLPIFHPPCFHSNQTYPNGKYSFMLLLNIFSKIILRKYSFRVKLFSHTINHQDKVFLK